MLRSAFALVVLFSWLVPASVRAAALTIELPASERACFFADVDQIGEKIGAGRSLAPLDGSSVEG